MKLYHGSRFDLKKLNNKQAEKAEDLTDVPEEELQDGIYLSPDYGFALAMGTRLPGITEVGNDDKTIKFEHPELFDPESNIFMYTFDSDKIPTENIELEYIDKLHYIAKGKDKLTSIELTPLEKKIYKN